MPAVPTAMTSSLLTAAKPLIRSVVPVVWAHQLAPPSVLTMIVPLAAPAQKQGWVPSQFGRAMTARRSDCTGVKRSFQVAPPSVVPSMTPA